MPSMTKYIPLQTQSNNTHQNLRESKMGFEMRVYGWIAIAISMAICLCPCLSSEETNGESCNLYEGTWVYDESYPLYDSSTCPHIRLEYDCLKYGRVDKEYLKYRWKPSICDLPRYTFIKLYMFLFTP